ncbi:MAG: sulfur reduction protein DsrS [Pseudomonadota bacterium]
MPGMELTPEDALRINVLLAGTIDAIRIDESRMTIYGLSEKGEAKVQLNPNCRDESYLRCVRETLSSHVLGSPGGYPVYLKRWTRMGQARDETLESLLKLGEPEAVIAVVNATGITDELARRAWWASQTSDNARCMLRQDAVVHGKMGPVLAEFLVEFLPFEEEACNQIASVCLVLQEGLIETAERQQLWDKARHKNAFYVGFLQATPDDLPDEHAANPAWATSCRQLDGLLAQGNPFSMQLCRLLSPAGQSFLACTEAVLNKPANQDVMVELMHALDTHAAALALDEYKRSDIEDIVGLAEGMMAGEVDAGSEPNQSLQQLIQAHPNGAHHIHAMLVLALLSESVLNPVFSRTDAIGTVMRKKLKPVTDPIHEQINILKSP